MNESINQFCSPTYHRPASHQTTDDDISSVAFSPYHSPVSHQTTDDDISSVAFKWNIGLDLLELGVNGAYGGFQS